MRYAVAAYVTKPQFDKFVVSFDYQTTIELIEARSIDEARGIMFRGLREKFPDHAVKDMVLLVVG